MFTPESRSFLAGMLSTPAQMDNSVNRLKNCEVEHLTYNKDRTRAVLFHSLANRACAPFLFEKGKDGKWRLDLKALGLGTNHTFGNIWYIHYSRYGESGIWKYNFGFRHVYFHRPRGEHGRFDHQGIPYYYKYGAFMNHVASDMFVTQVFKNSFADKVLELKEGDQIIEWEGRRFLHVNQLAYRLDHVRPGLDIRVVYRRGNNVLSKIVKAPSYPKKGQLRFGFSFRSLPPIYQGKYHKTPIIHYIELGSPAEKLGLKVNDLIIKWQDKQYPYMGEIYQWMREAKPGAPLIIEVFRHGQNVILKGHAYPLRKMSKVS